MAASHWHNIKARANKTPATQELLNKVITHPFYMLMNITRLIDKARDTESATVEERDQKTLQAMLNHMDNVQKNGLRAR